MCHFAVKWWFMTWLLNSVGYTFRRWPLFIPNRHLRSHVPRVVQGYDDIHNRYPYVVCIMYKLQIPEINVVIAAKQCTGSLITSRWVLTAAHCDEPTEELMVKCDNISIPWSESKCKAKVLKIITHPSYLGNELSIVNDIALMLIDEIVMKRYGTLHAADYKNFMGRSVKYAGFGFTKRKLADMNFLEEFSKPLQIGEGVVFKDDMKMHFMQPRILVGLKCSNREQFSHMGDSGGPLFIDDRIAGVLSGGPPPDGPSLAGHPDPIASYCPVSPYLTWIMDIVTRKLI